MKEKFCSKCKQIKPVLEFYENPLSKNGFRSQCKKCELAIRAKNHIKNKRDNESYFWRMKAKYANDARFRTKLAKSQMKEKIKPLELKELYQQNSFCNYCNVYLSKDEIVFDHLTPMSRGGKHSIENICISCKDCNNLKGVKTEEEFTSFLKNYILRFQKLLKEDSIRPVENGGTWASRTKIRDEGTFRTATKKEVAESGRNDLIGCLKLNFSYVIEDDQQYSVGCNEPKANETLRQMRIKSAR